MHLFNFYNFTSSMTAIFVLTGHRFSAFAKLHGYSNISSSDCPRTLNEKPFSSENIALKQRSSAFLLTTNRKSPNFSLTKSITLRYQTFLYV